MRKQIDGLVALVQLEYRHEMNEESLFLFCGCRSYRIKALYWDGTGHVLLYKRLSEKRFQWPRNPEELKRNRSIIRTCQRVRSHEIMCPTRRIESKRI